MERQLQRQQQKQQQQLLQQHEQLRTEHQERLALNYRSRHQDPRHQRQHVGRTADEAEDADEEDEDEENDEDGQETRSKSSETQDIGPRKHHAHVAQSNPQQETDKDSAATASNSNRPRKYNKSKTNGRGATSTTVTTPNNAPKRQYKKTILRQQAALLAAQLKEENKARDSEATRRVLARTGVIKHIRRWHRSGSVSIYLPVTRSQVKLRGGKGMVQSRRKKSSLATNGVRIRMTHEASQIRKTQK
ncbi:hypothetical protein BGZ68_008577 [Mortierella alpina]|nr:hypothetical protein BGZ68_008577 [Mortierella alpina]